MVVKGEKIGNKWGAQHQRGSTASAFASLGVKGDSPMNYYVDNWHFKHSALFATAPIPLLFLILADTWSFSARKSKIPYSHAIHARSNTLEIISHSRRTKDRKFLKKRFEHSMSAPKTIGRDTWWADYYLNRHTALCMYRWEWMCVCVVDGLMVVQELSIAIQTVNPPIDRWWSIIAVYSAAHAITLIRKTNQ